MVGGGEFVHLTCLNVMGQRTVEQHLTKRVIKKDTLNLYMYKCLMYLAYYIVN